MKPLTRVTLTLTGRSCIRDINSCCPCHEGLHRDSSAGVEAASASRGSFQMSACDASLPPHAVDERCHLSDISPPSRFISTIINHPSNNALAGTDPTAVTRRTRALPSLLCRATPRQWKPRQIRRARVTLSHLHNRATATFLFISQYHIVPLLASFIRAYFQLASKPSMLGNWQCHTIKIIRTCFAIAGQICSYYTAIVKTDFGLCCTTISMLQWSRTNE